MKEDNSSPAKEAGKLNPRTRAILLTVVITTILAAVGALMYITFTTPTQNAPTISGDGSTNKVIELADETASTGSKALVFKDLDASGIIDLKSLGYSDQTIQTMTGGIAEHARGKLDSEVVVLEYADFQCPGCASMMPRMEEIYAEYSNRVAFIFRNYPLMSIHEQAHIAARAAEAAGEQGFYWEMYEGLFNYRSLWIEETNNNLLNAFTDIFQTVAPKGDKAKFRDDIKSTKYDAKINFDYTLGSKVSGVTYTPAIFVNGEPVDVNEAKTLDDLKALIVKMIEAEL